MMRFVALAYLVLSLASSCFIWATYGSTPAKYGESETNWSGVFLGLGVAAQGAFCFGLLLGVTKISEDVEKIRIKLVGGSDPSGQPTKSAGGDPGSVGIEFRDTTTASIIAVEPGSPADKAGITAGCKIWMVDSKPITNSLEAIPLLSGEVGTQVEIQIIKDGASGLPKKYTLTRAKL